MSNLFSYDIGLEHFLILSSILFIIGMYGIVINRKSIITILLSIEIMLLSININFVAFSFYLHDIVGQVFVIFILTVAAAETAIGLSIIVLYFRNNKNIDIEKVSIMKK